MKKEKLHQIAKERMQEMAADLMDISSIPAINPRMNGTGEYKRMQWILAALKKYELPFEVFDIPDDAVEEGVRRNIVVKLDGKKQTDKTLWLIAHVDTVNTGALENWLTDPFVPVEKDGKIYGLGVEDNSQAVITLLHTARILKECRVETDCNIGFIFASDEEIDSKYGLRALIKQNLFSEKDEAIVPDGGSPNGAFVEIAEKSQVWIRFTVNGKQAHAAMPDLGINACSIGMHMGVEIEDTLKKEFCQTDKLFQPPYSTFELTQKFANVDSPNVLPGKDVFTIDMRILPCYTVEEVIRRIREIISKYEEIYKGITVEMEFVTRVDAPQPTSKEESIVKHLIASIQEMGVEAYYGGIGGGTCAAILREQKIPAVVWSALDELAHQPNEYVVKEHLVTDVQVYLSTILKYLEG